MGHTGCRTDGSDSWHCRLSRLSRGIVANVAFVASDVNRSIGVSGPEVYLKKIDARILRSQCVPLDKSLWRIEN